MAEVIVITAPGNETGFQLAGFLTEIIDKSQATETLDQISRDGKYGLVCIEESLYSAVKKDVATK